MHSRTKIIIATLSVLALAGAGCARKSSTAPGSALTPGASVDIDVKATTDTGSGASVTVDASSGGTVTITDEGTAPKDEGPKVPEGWKVYESEKYQIRFALPSSWDVKEDSKIGIVISEVPISEPLPSDLLGFPLIMNMDTESVEEYEKRSKSLDPTLLIDEVVFDGVKGKRYSTTGAVAEEDEPGISFRFPRQSAFLEIGVNTQADPNIVQAILNTIEF